MYGAAQTHAEKPSSLLHAQSVFCRPIVWTKVLRVVWTYDHSLRIHILSASTILPRSKQCRRLNSYNFGATDFDYATGSMVCTVAAGIVRAIIHNSASPQMSQLLNNCWIFCLNKRIRFQTGSIVATIALRLVATIVQPSWLLMASPQCRETALHNHQTNCYACTKDKTCNVRNLTWQICIPYMENW
jgi:hypothetical protein